MGSRIRGSDVYVVEDIERILAALAGAARRYAGEYGAGYGDALRDVAKAVGGRVDGVDRVDVVREVVEYRHERTQWSTVNGQRSMVNERAPAEPRFAIRGEREAWPAATHDAPVNMNGDGVNVKLFNPAAGRLVARDVGYGWLGNDGYTAFWSASDWQQVPTAEAQAWGELVPDEWAVLARHAYASEKRRQIGQPARVLPTERRTLR